MGVLELRLRAGVEDGAPVGADLVGAARRQHLEHRHAQREDVGAPVLRLPLPLLRGHVGRGSGQADGLPEEVGQAEVHHLHAARLGEEDVAGLEVAVQEPGSVGVGQRAGHLAAHVHGLVHRKWTAGQPRGQRLAPEQLEDQVRAGLALPVVEDGDDVLVLEAGRRLGLLEQHGVELPGPHAGAHRLEGHRAPQVLVAGLEDHAEAAAADLLHHLEAPHHHSGGELLRGAGLRELLEQERAPLRSGQDAREQVRNGGFGAWPSSTAGRCLHELLHECRAAFGSGGTLGEKACGKAGHLGAAVLVGGGTGELLENGRPAFCGGHDRRESAEDLSKAPFRLERSGTGVLAQFDPAPFVRREITYHQWRGAHHSAAGIEVRPPRGTGWAGRDGPVD